MRANVAIVEPAETSSPSRIAQRRAQLEADTQTAVAAVWEPPPSNEAVARAPELSASVVSAVVAVATRPLRPDEGHKIGHDNKEKELRDVFNMLTPAEALLVRRRISADRSSDELVVAFRRLTVERRTRLLAFLADPRRGR